MPVITKTPQGEDIVILSRAEYDALTAGRSGEDRADAAHANEILNEIEKGTETLLTSEQADRLLEAKTPLSFWRRHRGITQEALSKSIGVAQGFISEIENGSKTGDIQTLAAIARVLAISLDDLVIAKPIRRTKRQQAGKRTTTAGRRQTPHRAIKPNSKKSVSSR